MKKLISVVFTTFNEKNITESIQHLKQALTYKNSYKFMDCFIVDDNSDISWFNQHISPLEDTGLGIRIHRFKVNYGSPSAGRNYAIDHLSGKYFIWMDGDDLVHEHIFDSLKKHIKKLKFDIGFIAKNGHRLKKDQHKPPLPLEGVEIVDSLYKLPNGFSSGHGVIFKSEFIKNCRFPIGIRNSEDRVFMTKVKLLNIDSFKKICNFRDRVYYTQTLTDPNIGSLSDKNPMKMTLWIYQLIKTLSDDAITLPQVNFSHKYLEWVLKKFIRRINDAVKLSKKNLEIDKDIFLKVSVTYNAFKQSFFFCGFFPAINQIKSPAVKELLTGMILQNLSFEDFITRYQLSRATPKITDAKS